MSMRISNDRGLLIPTWPAFDNNDVFNEVYLRLILIIIQTQVA